MSVTGYVFFHCLGNTAQWDSKSGHVRKNMMSDSKYIDTEVSAIPYSFSFANFVAASVVHP